MISPDPHTWQALNDRYVTAAVGWVCALLSEHVSHSQADWSRPAASRRRQTQLVGTAGCDSEYEQAAAQWPPEESAVPVADALASLHAAQQALEMAGCESSLHLLSRRFHLGSFEQNVLLLCLAFELESRVGWMCGIIQDHPQRAYPTFGLAMSLFDDPEWGALLPEGRLRLSRLIELRQPSGTPLVGAELRLEETVLHYLRGVPSLDPRLRMLVSPAMEIDGELSSSQAATVRRVCQAISEAKGSIVVQLLNGDVEESMRVAGGIARASSWQLHATSIDCLPTLPAEQDDFLGLWERDSSLFGLTLAIDVRESVGREESVKLNRTLRSLINSSAPVLVLSRERIALGGVKDICVDSAVLSIDEQLAMWRHELPQQLDGRHELAGALSRQFAMSASSARGAVAAVQHQQDGKSEPVFRRLLWRECRGRTRPQLEGLAQKIDVKALWTDIVLSPDRAKLLKQIRDQVQSRWRVYDEWGFALRMNRGLGISALFAGDSGTGKTMAAEVIASELDLDLYRVDLSSVVSKYIGETEKHLRRLFDAFESCGAILFFDECDALFGKRSEVKDSHDRYANIEVNYLLQRLESYRGLAILATNNRAALDAAFLRRLRFVVNFAMPTADERKRIWERLLPAEPEKAATTRIPVAALDYDRLAQFQISGGSIQNIVLNAAFRAASRQDRKKVTMGDMLAAARDEYVKLERPINESDFKYVESARDEAAA